MRSLIICFIISILCIGCVNTSVFEQNQSIEKARWEAENALRFEFIANDTLANHNVFLNVRHTGNYAYSNLYLFVTTQAPNGRLHIDTLEFTLANTTGKWIGKGIGDVYDLRMVYKKNIRFGQQGKYSFKIEQAMREPVLDGIADVGIRIE